MKKMIFALMVMLTATVSASAMSYEQARNEALFLTDKMAYELNLTDAQYEAAYEINLDYLMGVTSVDDVFGTYWERRNMDLNYILYSWQWEAFMAASYFYRPLYWNAGYWHFGIYVRYPRRDYFYFGRPHFYATYRGGHAWHVYGGRGYYCSHSSHFRPALANGRSHFGMRNSYDRGDYRGSRAGSSTRITGRQNGYNSNRSLNGNSNYNNGRSYNSNRSQYGAFGGSRNGNSSSYSRSNNENSYNRSGSSSTFGGSRSSYNRSGSSSSFGGNRSSSSSSYSRGSVSGSGINRSGSSSFGGSRSSSSSYTRSSAGGSSIGRSSGSHFGGSRSSGGSSHSSGSHSGGHFGGSRH